MVEISQWNMAIQKRRKQTPMLNCGFSNFDEFQTKHNGHLFVYIKWIDK